MTDTPEWSGWAEYPPTPAPPAGSGAAPAGPADSAGSEPTPEPPPPFSAPSGFDWTPSGAGYQAAGPPPGPAAPLSTAAPAGRPRHTVAVAAVVAVAMFFAGAAGGALIVNATGHGNGNAHNAALDTIPGQPTTTQPSTNPPSSDPSSPSTLVPSTPSNPSAGDDTPNGTTPAPSNGDNTVSTGVVDINTTLANDSGQAAGTGMILTSSGLVLTNNHVIENASKITAQIDGVGKTYNATVLGYDATNDVALLQLQNASGLDTVTIGTASSVNIGDHVTAVGNALGRSGPEAVVPAVVTSLHEDITVGGDDGSDENLRDMIEVNGGILPGDSGGPVIDSSNRVIGMTTAGSSARGRRSSSSTTGFAIPIDNAKAIINQIRAGKASGTVHIGSRGILGVQLSSGTGRGSSSTAATVGGVQSGSPADKAGMKAGDTIRSVDGKNVSSVDDVSAALYQHHGGDKVSVNWVDANGQQHQANVTLAEGPPA